MNTSTSKEFYRQFGKKIYTKIGKHLVADKENRSPNENNKQKHFHFKPVTFKSESHLPKHMKKGGSHKKTHKHRRTKSKRPRSKV